MVLALAFLSIAGAEGTTITGGEEGVGYWSLQLSPNSVSTVPFKGRHISVWEDANRPGRYYAMPLVELLPGTARAFHSVLVGMHVMQFDVLMWTEEARAAVFDHLRLEGRTGEGEGKSEQGSRVLLYLYFTLVRYH